MGSTEDAVDPLSRPSSFSASSSSSSPSSSSSSSTSSWDESTFEAELALALDATAAKGSPGVLTASSVRVVESRGSFSIGHVIIELHPPALTAVLVRALTLRALGPSCDSSAAGFAEWLRDKSAVAACKMLTRGTLTRSIDRSAGVLADGGSREPSLSLETGVPAPDDDWVQLAPELVRGEGVLITSSADDEGASSSAFGALVLLLLAVLCTPLLASGYQRARARAEERLMLSASDGAGGEDRGPNTIAGGDGGSSLDDIPSPHLSATAIRDAACELTVEAFETHVMARMHPAAVDTWHTWVKPALTKGCAASARTVFYAVRSLASLLQSGCQGPAATEDGGGVASVLLGPQRVWAAGREWVASNTAGTRGEVRLGTRVAVPRNSVAVPLTVVDEEDEEESDDGASHRAKGEVKKEEGEAC